MAVAELDERVRSRHMPGCRSHADDVVLQAKEHDIYDTAPFLQSRLFAANGYTLNGDVIEKRFKQQS